MRLRLQLVFICVGFVCFSKIGPVVSQQVTKVTKTDFPQQLRLKGEAILDDDFNHHHMIYVNDTILLTTANSGKYHYHVFHKTKLNYLGSIGVRGEGPGEWEIPSTTAGQFEKGRDGIKVWHFDYLRGNFELINITKTINSKSPTPIVDRRLRIDARSFPFYQLFMGSNQRIYTNAWIYEQNRGRIKYIDLKTNKIQKSDLFPKIADIEHLPTEVINSLYGAPFDKHPNKDVFVQAMFMFNRIDFFDANLNLTNSIVDGDNWKDNFYNGRDIKVNENFLRPRINGYDGLSVGEKFVFVLEAKKNVGTDQFKENQSFIRVFTLDGKPLSYIEILHDLSSIDYDESSGVLYATDYSHELVLRFDLARQSAEWKL
ncbi:BF3164 family lipoprotein [Algoriphagus confluentis]|uniref:TolB-like 6-blade propeller-like n=1 Tax=Algoriphagus confluentis TaxID=1697556 RepID=A0ABQ6PVL3_9BACT|nr:hypothetical protein Aconfl_39790 [Algoriphagus confluentis]